MKQLITKVLLIDDDEDDHMIFEEAVNAVDPAILVDHIYCFKDLPSGAPCNIPDLLFLDINMPDKNGFEWLDLIKMHHPQLPVVMYSTSSTRDEIFRSFNAGLRIFMRKPSNFSELVQNLKILFGINWNQLQDMQHTVVYEGVFHHVK